MNSDFNKQTHCEKDDALKIQSEALSSFFISVFTLKSQIYNSVEIVVDTIKHTASCMTEVLYSFRGMDAQVFLCILHPHTI